MYFASFPGGSSRPPGPPRKAASRIRRRRRRRIREAAFRAGSRGASPPGKFFRYLFRIFVNSILHGGVVSSLQSASAGIANCKQCATLLRRRQASRLTLPSVPSQTSQLRCFGSTHSAEGPSCRSFFRLKIRLKFSS